MYPPFYHHHQEKNVTKSNHIILLHQLINLIDSVHSSFINANNLFVHYIGKPRPFTEETLFSSALWILLAVSFFINNKRAPFLGTHWYEYHRNNSGNDLVFSVF
jgi:hypothetical protein